MNLVYFNFLFIQTIKRKPIWITWILFLFTVSCFILILPSATGMNTLQLWANTTVSFSQTIMGMVASIFTAVLAINIFKDTREEGTELIVISKPISRAKIVLTKFFVFGLFCLLINLSTLLLTSFTILLPETEPRYYAGLMISMLIGNAVTFAIFGAISIFLSVKFAKMGVIIVNIVISLIFLIYQVLTAFIFNTPLKELDNKDMSALNYIVLQRNEETGDYQEAEIVKFDPSGLDITKKHPCQATNWQEMRDFWEKDIKSADPTPILNVTDLASQISLTYMSYKTHEFSKTQAQRFFGISRFYDYKLTSPASPELIGDIDNKQTLNWGYMDISSFDVFVPDIGPVHCYLPSTFGFPAVPALSETKIKGYGRQIPIGQIRTRELFSAKPVYFEKKDWMSYKNGFDAMYQDVFNVNYEGYYDSSTAIPEIDNDWSEVLCAWRWGAENYAKFYNMIWACLTGNAGQEGYMPGCPSSLFDKEYYDIDSIDDLNERFLQFKNYCFYKARDEQYRILESPASDEEQTARETVYNNEKAFWDIAGLDVPLATGNGWWASCKDGVTEGLLEPDSRAPLFDWLVKTWNEYRTTITNLDDAQDSSWTKYRKTYEILTTFCSQDEYQLYRSLQSPERTSKYSGDINFTTENWYPYLNGLLKPVLPANLPLGQNMQFFFYQVTPKVRYWVYAVIWGCIALAAYAGGAIVYNKYDIK